MSGVDPMAKRGSGYREAKPIVKCFDDEEHDIDMFKTTPKYQQYHCTKCGFTMTVKKLDWQQLPPLMGNDAS